MYRCENCGVNVPAGTKVQRVIVETRPKIYEAQAPPPGRKRKKMRGRFQATESHGWEIVKSLKVCSTCYGDLAEREAQVTAAAAAPPVREIVEESEAGFEAPAY